MNLKTSKTIMKCMGMTLAVCSAVAMASSTSMCSMSTKKMMKKTVNKVSDIVDAVSSFM